MARGFESKSVESQQEEAQRARTLKPALTPEERARMQQRQAIELALAVERNGFVRRNAGNDFGFVLLAHALEELDRLVARHELALNRKILLRDFLHALLDGGEVALGEWPLVREVIIKTVLDDRSNRDLRLGEQLLHGLRE